MKITLTAEDIKKILSCMSIDTINSYLEANYKEWDVCEYECSFELFKRLEDEGDKND